MTILFAACCLTAISAFMGACSSDEDPTLDVTSSDTDQDDDDELKFGFNDNGKLVVSNADIPTKEIFAREIDGHAWRTVSQGFILEDGSIRENNGNLEEKIVLLNSGKAAIMVTYTFEPEKPILIYDDLSDYNEQVGSIGLFNIMELSDDCTLMTIVYETSWYPDPAGKPVKGYAVEVNERLTSDEQAKAMDRYKVDMNQMVIGAASGDGVQWDFMSLEELVVQKRDSKKRPKLEYSTSTIDNSASTGNARMRCSVKEEGNMVMVALQVNSKDGFSVTFADKTGKNVYQHEGLDLYERKEISISPATAYPYTFKILSKNIYIFGTITKE